MPATPMENGPVQGRKGVNSRMSGVSTAKAKRPIATVGRPSSTSRIGLTIRRTRGLAYSDR